MNSLPHTFPSSALQEWRNAAALVQDRWTEVLAADRPSRRRAAYTAYDAAIDAEESAAAALATEPLPLAA
jgi:hypothetical protein